MAKTLKPTTAPRITNRRAHHEFKVLEKIEVGMVLLGSEVKSIRNGQVSLAEGYARVEQSDMGLYLYDVDIAPYTHSAGGGHAPKRRRKLLAHARQIKHLHGQTTTKGITLVPLAIYFVGARAKLELGVAVGKRAYDKREALRTREHKRQMQRAMTRKVL